MDFLNRIRQAVSGYFNNPAARAIQRNVVQPVQRKLNVQDLLRAIYQNSAQGRAINNVQNQAQQIRQNPQFQRSEQNIAQKLQQVPNIKLRGIQQLFGQNQAPTLGDLGRNLPVVGEAIKFGTTPQPSLKQFTQGITSTGYKYSPVPGTIRLGARGAAELAPNDQVDIPTIGKVNAFSKDIREQGVLPTAINTGVDALDALTLGKIAKSSPGLKQLAGDEAGYVGSNARVSQLVDQGQGILTRLHQAQSAGKKAQAKQLTKALKSVELEKRRVITKLSQGGYIGNNAGDVNAVGKNVDGDKVFGKDGTAWQDYNKRYEKGRLGNAKSQEEFNLRGKGVLFESSADNKILNDVIAGNKKVGYIENQSYEPQFSFKAKQNGLYTREMNGVTVAGRDKVAVDRYVDAGKNLSKQEEFNLIGYKPERFAPPKPTVGKTPRAPKDNLGFYNTKNIKVGKPQKQAIQQVIDENRPQLEEVVGKRLSNKEVIEHANMTSKVLQSTVTKEQTKAAIAANLNLRRQIAKASQEGQVTPEMIDAILRDKANATNIARQLQARIIKAKPEDRTVLTTMLDSIYKVNKNTDEILKAAQGVDFNDARQATEFYRQFVAPRAEDWIDKLRYNSMLSSPTTHIINTSANFQGTGILAPIEKTAAGAVDAVRAAIGNGQRTRFAGEGTQYLKGYIKAFPEAVQRAKGVLSGRISNANPDIRDIPLATSGIKGGAEKLLSVPTRALEASDQFFQALTQGGAARALKFRVGKGVKVKNFDAEVLKEAQGRLFRGDLNPKGQGHVLGAVDTGTRLIEQARRAENPIARTVAKFSLPFVRTPTNILKQGIEYSPLGFTTMIGAGDKTAQFTKALLGTSVVAGGATLLGQDRLTFAEPTSEKQKQAFRESGRQAYSIKIGNKWVSYSKLHPVIGFNMALVAGIDDALRKKTIEESEADSIVKGATKWLSFFADQSYVKNVSDLIGSTKGDVESAVKLPSNYLQQGIPMRGLLSWVNRLIDPVQRKVDQDGSILEKQLQQIYSQIPGLAQQVPARLDSQGNPIPNENRAINAFSPLRITNHKEAGDTTYNKIIDKSIANKNKKLGKVTTSDDREPGKTLSGNTLADVDKIKENADKLRQELKGVKDSSVQTLVKYDRLSSDGKEKFKSSPKNVYDLAIANYDKDMRKGLNVATMIKREKEIAQLGVKKDFSKDAVDLYSLSKTDLRDVIEGGKVSENTLNELAKLDNAMLKAGFVKNSKFAFGKGGGGRRSSGRGKVKTAKVPTFKKVSISLKTVKASKPRKMKFKTVKLGKKLSGRKVPIRV